MAALDRFDGSFAHDCHLPISRDDLEFIESHCRQDSKESQIHSDEGKWGAIAYGPENDHIFESSYSMLP